MPRVPESFYEPDGDHYVATELTRGPWDPGAQHAGPPAALIGREIERLGGGRMGGGDGPRATVWMRMGVPLLPGEEPTALQRVLVSADYGNGVSVTLDWSRYLFINRRFRRGRRDRDDRSHRRQASLAEGEGFEPPDREDPVNSFQGCRNQPDSATPPGLTEG
jgi:hypothetical protein